MLTAAALALSLLSAPAGGDLADPAARAAFDRATAAYQAGDYDTAAEALAEAYTHEPAAELLYARAQMERLSGDCTTAIDLYRAYLATGPDKREDAEENLARCQALTAVQGKPEPPPPAPEPTPPAPVEPPDPQPRPEAPPDEDRVRSPFAPDTATIVLGGTGLVLTGVGAALVPLGIQRAKDASGPVHQQYADQIQSADRMRVAGISLLALGGATVVTAVIRYAVVTARRRRARP